MSVRHVICIWCDRVKAAVAPDDCGYVASASKGQDKWTMCRSAQSTQRPKRQESGRSLLRLDRFGLKVGARTGNCEEWTDSMFHEDEVELFK